MISHQRGLIPPKNMATPTSGKKLAAEPNAGWMAISSTGNPIMAETITKLRKSR